MAVGSGNYQRTVQQSLAKRGSLQDLTYVPAFRASGLFYATANAQTNTRVTCFNYWREKNENSDVSAVVTLRDANGIKVARCHEPMTESVHEWNVHSLLSGSHFTGTMEVEFFSSRDLKFAFPALTVAYDTEEGTSYVHTNQRVFNNAEDEERGSVFNVAQTSFDVVCDAEHVSFVFLANGARPSPDGILSCEFFNSNGDVLQREIKWPARRAYEALRVDLDTFPGLEEFLAGAPGFCKLRVPLEGVYHRFACGTRRRDDKWLGVTHTFFDCTEHADYFDATHTHASQYPAFVPITLVPGLETEFVLYPTMSPAKLQFSLECYDDKGALRAQPVALSDHFEAAGNSAFRLDLRSVLRSAGLEAESGLCAIVADASDHRIPARITFGLNYHAPARLGTNISSSVLTPVGHGRRSRSWLWGPLFCREGSVNRILPTLFHPTRENNASAALTLEIHSGEGQIFSKQYTLKNRTGLDLEVEKLLADAGHRFSSSESLWYVLKAADPCLLSNQLCISSQGRVGGDHSF